MEKNIDFRNTVCGSIIVLSGPSGVGKSTIIKKVREKMPELSFSVSCTTRPMRAGETPDVDYHFLSREEFLRRKEAGEFIESAEVFENFYGTLKSEVMNIAENGENVVLDIDVQGALQIMDKAKSLETHHWATRTLSSSKKVPKADSIRVLKMVIIVFIVLG